MITYIAIVLTIHTLVGLYSVVSTSIQQKWHMKMVQKEIEERNRFFDELARQLKESEVEP
jgi:hypothetical protein